jgi:hypothetical protein
MKVAEKPRGTAASQRIYSNVLARIHFPRARSETCGQIHSLPPSLLNCEKLRSHESVPRHPELRRLSLALDLFGQFAPLAG